MAKHQSKTFRKKDLSYSQQVYLEVHDNCGLCGTPLDFQVVSHGALPQIKEMATCPNCQITTRQKDYPIH
ncbi:MAG: hypothetical protein KDD61_16135 [Bdellovibrionales bacterium]|nr:hypothetical protein [Bdellovibrionales bacterium]